MSIQKKEKRIANNIHLVYDLSEKENLSQLRAQEDRAVIAKITADLVLPSNKVLTVDIDFDATSGYHDNAMMVMNDFGVEMLATAFEAKYGKQYADSVRKAWAEKQHNDDPRKPSYLLVQKPKTDDAMPNVYAVCGHIKHDDKKAPKSIT